MNVVIRPRFALGSLGVQLTVLEARRESRTYGVELAQFDVSGRRRLRGLGALTAAQARELAGELTRAADRAENWSGPVDGKSTGSGER